MPLHNTPKHDELGAPRQPVLPRLRHAVPHSGQPMLSLCRSAGIHFTPIERLREVLRNRPLREPTVAVFQQYFQSRREFPKDLATGAAGRAASIGPSRDRDRREFPSSLREGLEERNPFRADP